ncbi:unnamed protein product [Orchesella dallaii]|uniref:VWFA domain-containing protein n=1 Tax=Orchesella dallaii TaxID=48710 RepID=A0ABP1QID8_9HEXA
MRTLNILLVVGVAALFSPHPTSARDDTITEKSTGKDVTESVLRLISRSNIFPSDNSFLIRLAYVESRFGLNTNTFRTDYYGGIWQVEESVFRSTQSNHTSLTNLITAIESHFNINWHRLTWRDLLKPLHSGLAAALYFSRVPTSIPGTIENQAVHWRAWYRPLGDAAVFIADSEELKNQTRCRGKLDLCVLLDGSASLIESFTKDYTRIGMIVFSNGTSDIFQIDNNLSIEQMAAFARNASYPGQGTQTDVGIFRAISMFNNATSNEGVPKVLTVFTDGGSDRGSNMTGAIQAIRDNSIKSVSIGIGGTLNNTELHLIALNDTESVFYVNDFAALNDFLYTITSVACEIPQRPAINASVSDTLVQDEKRYYAVELPSQGITITLTINSGRTTGYWSRTESVPSSAVHDGVITGSVFISGGNRQAGAASVYVAVQGLENMNNYTIRATQGNTTGAFLFLNINLLAICIKK